MITTQDDGLRVYLSYPKQWRTGTVTSRQNAVPPSSETRKDEVPHPISTILGSVYPDTEGKLLCPI